MKAMSEEWRPVVGAEGFYEVSNIGNVRSLDRLSVRSDGVIQRRKGFLLKPCESGRKRNYLSVQIGYPNRRHAGVHVLVYESFVGSIPKGMEIDHKDRNTRNNTPENLRIATRSQNHANRGIGISNSSGLKGASYFTAKKKWCAQIKKEQKRIFIGYFDTKEEAHEAYAKAANELFGEYHGK